MKTALVIGVSVVATIAVAAAAKKFAPQLHAVAF